jgi:hypothetical protein
MDAYDVIEEFAALMVGEDAEAFRDWGDKWNNHWFNTTPFLAPEVRNSPWHHLRQQVGALSIDKVWREKARQIWDTKYSTDQPEIKFRAGAF